MSDFTKLVQNHLKWLLHSVRFLEKMARRVILCVSVQNKMIRVKKCETAGLEPGKLSLVLVSICDIALLAMHVRHSVTVKCRNAKSFFNRSDVDQLALVVSKHLHGNGAPCRRLWRICHSLLFPCLIPSPEEARNVFAARGTS